ncbi:MAG: AsmA family protein [Deltaproteobacteria bacterium]|nr:AsmA family protein [Deltaproteobacteria bacterium]
MRKWIIAASALLVLCIVAFVAVLNLNSLVRRNKDYLLAQAEQALGRKVSVGEAELTIFDGIGVRLINFALADDPAYSSEDFVRARDMQINVALWPLFRKEFQVKRIILHEPVIRLIRNANGDFNFATLGKKEKQEKVRGEVKKEIKPPAEKDSTAALFVSLVDISRGDLHFRDLKDGADLRLQQIDLKLSDLDFDKPVSAELAAALFSAKQNLKVKARVGPFQTGGEVSQLALDGQVQADPLDLGKLLAAAPRLGSALPKGVELAGVFRVKELKFKGTPQKLAFKGELEGTDGIVRIGKSFRKESGIPFAVSSDGQYANNTVFVRHTEVKLHSLALETKGEVRLGGAPELNLNFNSKPASLGGWEKILPALAAYQLAGEMQINATVRGRVGQGAAPQVLGTLSLVGASVKPPQFFKPVKDLNTKINFTGAKAEVKDTTLTLGRSRLRLAAVIEKFSPLTLSYKISTPELWPADYQAGLSEERNTDVIKNLTSEGQLAVQDSGVSFQGKLNSGQGTLYKVGYKNLEANLSVANRVATIRSLRVTALNGSVQGEGEYAFKDPAPQFSFASKMQGVDLKELYAALSPKAERDIRGKLNGEMKISGSGQKWDELKQSLRGQGEAEVVQGALLNFNLADGAMSGITGMPGLANMINPRLRKKYPETFAAKDTEFKEMKAQFDLSDGRVNVKNLSIAAADYSVQGNGWVELERRVNFRATLAFSQRLSADIGDSARETKYLFNTQNQIEIPFTISGKLPNVKPKPDMNLLGRMVQKGFLRRGTEELQRRFFEPTEPASPGEPAPPASKKRKRSSTEDAIRKGLEGLFKR